MIAQPAQPTNPCRYPMACRCTAREMMHPAHTGIRSAQPVYSPWVRSAVARTLPASDRTNSPR